MDDVQESKTVRKKITHTTVEHSEQMWSIQEVKNEFSEDLLAPPSPPRAAPRLRSNIASLPAHQVTFTTGYQHLRSFFLSIPTPREYRIEENHTFSHSRTDLKNSDEASEKA
jgi:hypothetical protein